MKRRFSIISLFLVCLPLVALIPLGRIGYDWLKLLEMGISPSLRTSQLAYDWVVWEEEDGLIAAQYVFPRGPAAKAGLQNGDIFYELDYQQYFNAEDLQHAVEGMPPGSSAIYTVLRNGELFEAEVQFTGYPTFLYPLSPTLWQFSIWGFVLASFFHILALIIVGPLAVRSKKAMFSLLLIASSSLWICCNLLRLLTIEILGPPDSPGSTTEILLQILTFSSFVGWIGFPAILLHKVINDAGLPTGNSATIQRIWLYFPVLVLGSALAFTSIWGNVGPLNNNALIAPILFYVSCYVATAAAIVLVSRPEGRRLPDYSSRWNRTGSILTFFAASAGALSILGVMPQVGIIDDVVAAWLIVGGQLLSVAPITLVSLATLQYGKINDVLGRGIVYFAVYGAVFVAFIGGLNIIESYLIGVDTSNNVIIGIYILTLFLIFERFIRHTQTFESGIFSARKVRTRQILNRFQLHIRSVQDFDTLAHETSQTIATAFSSKFVLFSIQKPDSAGEWITAASSNQPHSISNRIIDVIWPHFCQEGRLWGRNAEINDSNVPTEISDLLRSSGVSLVIPIMGDRLPVGLLLIGPKKYRRAVFNLEDLEMLRSVSAQVALASERLKLVERERALIRESAEAQLTALRAQINPHFLFNALNTIISLIEDRPHEAETTVEHLAAIFRHVLNTGSQPFITLEEECKLVSNYLAIEQMRFGPKLTIDLSIDPGVRNWLVPAFVIQTLVENAIKHGLEKIRGLGILKIECTQRTTGELTVIVADNGIGIPVLFHAPSGIDRDYGFFGIGLRNISSRIERLYGRSDLLHIESAPDEGTRVRLTLPKMISPENQTEKQTFDPSGINTGYLAS